MATEKVFSTLDLYLASYISYRGLKPILERSNSKVIFTFPVSDDLYRLIESFNSNELTSIADYVTELKILRGRMLSMKGC